MVLPLKAAELKHQVRLDGDRLSGKVAFSRAGQRIAEIVDSRQKPDTGSARVGIYSASSGDRIFEMEKRLSDSSTWIWGDDDFARLAISNVGNSLEIVDLDLRKAYPIACQPFPLTSLVSFSPCGRWAFETNSFYAGRDGMSCASVFDLNGKIVLDFPEWLSDASWPYIQHERIIEDGDRPGFPPAGMKFDPAWSLDGDTGAATIAQGYGEGNGITLLPGLARTAGICHTETGRPSPGTQPCIAFVWSMRAGDHDSSERRTVSIYLPPYALAVTHLEFSDRKDVFLALSQDGSCRLYDATAGTCLRTISFLGQLESGFLSPDGGHMVAMSADGRATIINLDTGKLVERFEVAAIVTRHAMSPCGGQIAVGLADGSVCLKELHSGAETQILKSSGLNLRSIRFVAEGDRVLVSGDSRWLTLNPATFVPEKSGSGDILDVTKDGRLAAIQDGPDFRIENLVTGEVNWSVEATFAEAKFTSGGTYLDCRVEESGERRRFDAVAGVLLAETQSIRTASMICNAPDGRSVSVVTSAFIARPTGYTRFDRGRTVERGPLGRGPEDAYGSTSLWLLDENEVIATIGEHGDAGPVTAKVCCPDGTALLLARVNDLAEEGARAWLELIDTCDGEVRPFSELRNPSVMVAAMSFDGESVLTVDDFTDIRIWNSRTGRVQGYLSAFRGGRVAEGHLSEDGKLALTTRYTDASQEFVLEAFVWNVASGELLAWKDSKTQNWQGAVDLASALESLEVPDEGETTFEFDDLCGQIVSTSPDGSRAIVWDGTDVIVFDGVSGIEMCRLEFSRRRSGQFDAPCAISFSADGTHFIVVPDVGPPRVYLAELAELVSVCDAHVDDVMSAQFSPNADCALVIYESGIARLWGERTNGKVINLHPGLSVVEDCFFSPDGGLVLARLTDGSARLFEACSGKGLMEIRSQEGEIETCTFSADGAFVRTLSGSLIETWNIKAS